MKVLILYDTVIGQTEKAAQAISSGMKEVGFTDVVLKRIKEASEDDFRSADVWIIGSPTHFNGTTGAVKKGAKIAAKAAVQGKKLVAFDTRYAGVDRGATDKIAELFSDAGAQAICEPGHFIVTKALVDGEEAKATTFGRKIAGALRP
ncbi:MAG: flavodoxin domain-containing protein [Methanomassiliicoccales archaeon]|nr:flavodoxin domain-containing protein [Methanomassiliicoccales archaeon]